MSEIPEQNEIKVYIRVRPLLKSLDQSIISFPQNQGRSRTLTLHKSLINKNHENENFSYDYIADDSVDQKSLFLKVESDMRLVGNVLAGYSTCIFCYGQTGSGKTWTI